MIELEMDRFGSMTRRHLIDAARRGETIVLTLFGRPVAEVKPLPAVLEPQPRAAPGAMADQILYIHPNAFDPETLLKASDEGQPE